jgi:hypothetical protein
MSYRKILYKEDEEIANVTIRSDNSKFSIYAKIIPLYCCNCKSQIDGLYELLGSRYGFVGTVKCACGADINIVDPDSHPTEFIDTSTTLNEQKIADFHIDFKKLYKLNDSTFELIEKGIGFNIAKACENHQVDLKEIINIMQNEYNIETDSSKDYYDLVFQVLPSDIKKWYGIIDTINNKQLLTTRSIANKGLSGIRKFVARFNFRAT